MEPDTIEILKSNKGKHSWTSIVEKTIKDGLENENLNISEYEASGKEKIGFFVRVDVELYDALIVRCIELGIRRNIFLENAFRLSYPEYFQ